MRNVITVALCALIVGCAAWLFFYYSSQPEPGDVEPHHLPLACVSCNRSYEDDVTDEPARCKFCGKRTAWRALKCAAASCQAVVPWVREASDGPAIQFKCPKCGGTKLVEVLPEDLK